MAEHKPTRSEHRQPADRVLPDRAQIDRQNQRDDRSAQAAMKRDASDVAPGPMLIAGSQARGLVIYGVIGLFVGVAIGALLALIPIADWSYLSRFAMFGGISGLAGLTAGSVYGGGREPEIEGKVQTTLDAKQFEHYQDFPTAHIDEDMAHKIEEAIRAKK